MIQVYLTKTEKKNLKREARINGVTMSTLAAHKFMAHTNPTGVVIGTAPKGRASKFTFSAKPNLKAVIEQAAFRTGTTTSEYMRELIVNG